TRCLSDWSSDVCSSDLFEEVAVGREGLDPTLRAAATQRQGGRHIRLVLEADNRRDLLEALQVRWIEVEHRSAVAEDAGIDVDHEIGRASCRERGEVAGD